MRTIREYKIDKYIELARLTRDLKKREIFIDSAQYYLELPEEDVRKLENFTIPYLTSMNKEDFLGLTSEEAYEGYVDYCKDNDQKPIAINAFSKEVSRVFDINKKQKRINGMRVRVFQE